jgi:hypothetical protein
MNDAHSEIEWSFMTRRGGSDLYRFTRRRSGGSGGLSTTNVVIEFTGSRVVVFEETGESVRFGPPVEGHIF